MTEYASGLILFDIIDEQSYIGRITINNPEKRNAISNSMCIGFSNLLHDCLKNYKTLRAIILKYYSISVKNFDNFHYQSLVKFMVIV